MLSPGACGSGKGPKKKGLGHIVYWNNGQYMSCVMQREAIFKPISSTEREKLKFLKFVEGRGSWVGAWMSGQAQRGPPRPQPSPLPSTDFACVRRRRAVSLEEELARSQQNILCIRSYDCKTLNKPATTRLRVWKYGIPELLLVHARKKLFETPRNDI